MKLNKLFSLTILSVLFLVSCGDNILTSLADKKSDAALIYEINLLNNKKNYDEAISKFPQLSVAKLAERETQFLLAKVYGGLCGFDFLSFITVLGDIAPPPAPATTLFKTLMNAAPASTGVQIDHCISSETTITTYAASVTDRTVDENLFLFLLELFKMGTILNTHFDANDDQITDTVDACSTTVLPNSGTELYIQHMITGFSLMTLSSVEISSAAIAEATTALTAACDIASGLGTPICDSVTAASVTIDQQKAMRTLIKESVDIGLGVSCTGDVSSCNCP